MRLGIDIDDTIVNTHEVALNYVNKYAKHLNIKNYEHFRNMKLIEFYQEYLEDIQRNVTLFKGAKEALMTLKEKGYKLIFITARGSDYEFFIDYDYVGVTEEIFKKHNIPYDKIIYRCYPKGLKAKEEKIDIFIDDKEENLDDISKHGIKCIKKVDDLTNKSNYKQFDNWEDILKYILKLEGELNGK